MPMEAKPEQCESCKLAFLVLQNIPAPPFAVDKRDRRVCAVCAFAPHAWMTQNGQGSQHEAHTIILMRCLFYCTNIILNAIQSQPNRCLFIPGKE